MCLSGMRGAYGWSIFTLGSAIRHGCLSIEHFMAPVTHSGPFESMEQDVLTDIGLVEDGVITALPKTFEFVCTTVRAFRMRASTRGASPVP